MQKSAFQTEIIDRLKQQRIACKASQRDIAFWLQRSEALIGEIESSRFPQKYTLAEIHLLCRRFELPIEQLFLSPESLARDENVIDLLITEIIRYVTGK